MRIINKKYLLIILFVGIILTGVIVGKSDKLEKVNNEISSQKISNKTFAMYTETNSGYEEYKDNKFPEGYVLNIDESKCIDNNGKEVENVLSYNNGEITVTSGKTTYCYLYFDKSLGLEIKEENPNGLKIDKVRGSMYRFQGQATEEINNYICFGTSDKDKCTGDTNHYMYRIIGIEASSGRVKVIKKEALNGTYQWYTDYHTDIKLPESKFFTAINGDDFLKNTNYVPKSWEEKISDNTWIYGDMWENSDIGAKQLGAGLYDTESGHKSTSWYVKSTLEDGGIQYQVEWDNNDQYDKGTTLYYKEESGLWNNRIDSKISLMYLHDYSYSVGDEAKCDYHYGVDAYSNCKLGWMHLSQNDTDVKGTGVHEWTMTRNGWSRSYGSYHGFSVDSSGCVSTGRPVLTDSLSVRPVFYIDASQTLKDGIGTIDNPFIIN